MKIMLLAFVVLAGSISAQERKYSGAWELLKGEYDKNGDGKVAAAEYPRGETRFQRLDRNGDGFITQEDVGSGGRGRPGGGGGGRGGRRPRGNAPTLTPAEIAGRCLARLMDPEGDIGPKDAEKWFADLDADRSGGLGKDELTCVSSVWQRQAMRVLDKDDDAAITLVEVKQALTLADRDQNGLLTRAEYARGDRATRGGGRRAGPAPRAGTVAPDFHLRTLDGKRKVRLSDHAGKTPVALIFGSYT